MIRDNTFEDNRTGVAIEHGQNNRIIANSFTRDSTAINLWANPIEPSDWGYPKHRDTRSRDYLIRDNRFQFNRVALRVAQSTGVRSSSNAFTNVDSAIVRRDSSMVLERDSTFADRQIVLPKALPGGFPVRANHFTQLGRAAIIVDEWGPYDWRSPKLWPAGSSLDTPLKLRVLGPPGTWQVVEQSHPRATVLPRRGRMGDTITVTPLPGNENNWFAELIANGQRVNYSRFQPIGAWDVKFVAYTDSVDFSAPPIVTLNAPRLDYMWYRPTIPGLPQSKFAATAAATVELAAGEYTLRTISDDGIRVWVDDVLVIDNWKPHGSEVNHVPIAPGRHTLRVEYYQVDGWVELRVEIVRGRQQSTGSPGPH